MQPLTSARGPRPRARRLPLLALAGAGCALLACAPREQPHVTRLPASIRARTPDGNGVAGVRMWADGRELGTTDAGGRLATTLQAPEGARAVITAACPSTHRTLDERRELIVRALRAGAERSTPPRLQLDVTCEPLELLVPLVVRVRGELPSSLPIRARDQVVGQTGPDGVAHIVLRSRPEASLTVQLDTSAQPRLEPKDPARTFQLGKEPTVLVFDQTLTRLRPARRLARAPRPSPADQRLPYRVD